MQTFRSNVIPIRPSDQNTPIAGAADWLTVEIDHNDSPITKGPSEWFVCFVPGLKKQWWHEFTHPKHKHVFALKMLGDDQWLLVEPWWTRIMVTVVRIDEAVKFLRWGAAGDILKVTERIPGNGSQARGWANCAVLISLMLGRSYPTWTPHGLYKRLSAEDGVEPVNLAAFLEGKLISMTQAIVAEGLGDLSALTKFSPEVAFTELGRRISKTIFSQRYIGLHRLAVSEAPRFPAAAEAFFLHGPHQAAASIENLISHFCRRGQFRDCDRARTSRAFLSMLQGNLYQQAVLGCGTDLKEKDLESRTKSLVNIFLCGGSLSSCGRGRPPQRSSWIRRWQMGMCGNNKEPAQSARAS